MHVRPSEPLAHAPHAFRPPGCLQATQAGLRVGFRIRNLETALEFSARMEGSSSHRDVSPSRELLAIARTRTSSIALPPLAAQEVLTLSQRLSSSVTLGGGGKRDKETHTPASTVRPQGRRRFNEEEGGEDEGDKENSRGGEVQAACGTSNEQAAAKSGGGKAVTPTRSVYCKGESPNARAAAAARPPTISQFYSS